MATDNVTASPPLTAKLIEAAHPAAKEYELPDVGAPGLRLRVTPKGSKVFRWYVTRNGRQQVVTVGRWTKNPQPGRVTLGEARSWLGRPKLTHKSGTFDGALAVLVASRPSRGRSLGFGIGRAPLTRARRAENYLSPHQP